MRGRGLWKLAAAAACVLVALYAAAALSPSKEVGPCTVVDEPAMLREVPEASGLAVSRRHAGIFWTHNDSGNAPDLFAFDAAGTLHGRVRLAVRTRDWEDISAGRCPTGDCLYIGDIGDNNFARRSVQVYRVPEPEPRARHTARPEVFNITYPAGAPHNAEAMFIASERIFIVTKDRVGGLYGSVEPLGTNRDITLQRLGQLDLGAVTDAEASPDETSVAVRTSHEVVIYRTADLVGARPTIGSDSLTPVARMPIDGLREPQGEGVALGSDGMLYLASEGRPSNRAGLLISLRCATRLP